MPDGNVAAVAVAEHVAPGAPGSETITSLPLWQPLGVALALAIVYWDVALNMAEQWSSDSNWSHGFFVPLFSAYLIYEKRAELAKVPLRPAFLAGFIAIIGGLAMLIVGTLGVEFFTSRSALLPIVAGCVLCLYGWPLMRAVAFPWAVLVLMIPVPAIVFNQVMFPLQIFASELSAALLPLAGVPVLREGNVIHLPAMPLEVAEACSGIRSLVTLTTLSVIYGYFLESRNVVRILLVAAAVPIAVIANAFRVFGTGVLVQHWDPEKALGFFHEFSGWVIFVVSVVILFSIHGVLRIAANRLSRESA